MVVDVALGVAVRLNVLELLEWSVSPPYAPETPIDPSLPRLGV